VLGQPARVLLVSHCGLHSIYEAAFHGVPVVGLPFMFEQVMLPDICHA
jgi:glucuronosyltransferase